MGFESSPATERARVLVTCKDPSVCRSHRGPCMCGLPICRLVQEVGRHLRGAVGGPPWSGECLQEVGTSLTFNVSRDRLVSIVESLDVPDGVSVVVPESVVLHDS